MISFPPGCSAQLMVELQRHGMKSILQGWGLQGSADQILELEARVVTPGELIACEGSVQETTAVLASPNTTACSHWAINHLR